MPVEGISMTTVFSLVIVGLALGMSVFLGGYFLQPSFNIESVMGGVAYDLAAMYDVAYTLPGEVLVYYYGPEACSWNPNQDPNSVSSFHCFSGEAVIIEGVYLDTELLHVYNDPYIEYDSNVLGLEGLKDSVYSVRPSFYSINIPYYNAQLCAFSEDDNKFSSCAFTYAPFAASYSDIDMLTAQTPYELTVQDYSFVIEKHNVDNYYFTLDTISSNPDDLTDFLEVLTSAYTQTCEDANYLQGDFYTFNSKILNQQALNGDDEELYAQLPRAYRWHVYDDSIICQERLIISPDTQQEALQVDEDNELLLNSYVTDYCFDINSLVSRNPCININNVRFSQDFITIINDQTDYYASQSSCVKPYIEFANGDLVINALEARFNYFGGACENA